MCHQLSDARERAVEAMHRLLMEYAHLKNREKKEKSRRRDGQIGTRIFGGERESTRVPVKRSYRFWQRKRRKQPSLSNYRKRGKEKRGTISKGRN